MIKVTILDKDDIDDQIIKFAVICARHNGKWIFCRHSGRSAWEIPGGHREPSETVAETARRELYEETGALRFELTPLGIYEVDWDGVKSYGGLYFAEVDVLGELPDFEIDELQLFSDIPENLTYPHIQPALHARAIEYLQKTGSV